MDSNPDLYSIPGSFRQSGRAEQKRRSWRLAWKIWQRKITFPRRRLFIPSAVEDTDLAGERLSLWMSYCFCILCSVISRFKGYRAPLGVPLNPNIKNPTTKSGTADESACQAEHQNIFAPSLTQRVCKHFAWDFFFLASVCMVNPACALLNWWLICYLSSVHSQCGTQSSSQVTICARGRRISSYSHGNTRPRPSRHLPADLVGRRQETGAEV